MTWLARVAKVIDADTVDVTVAGTIRVRIADVSAPERGTDDGEAARAYLSALLPVGSAVTVDPKTEDPFGRVVGYLHLDVGERLIADGHAVRWP